MDYIIAIPSYNRPNEIVQKTLSLLHSRGIPPTRIYIFVSDVEQEQLYKKQVPTSLYHQIIVGVKGITRQRNFMTRYFAEGQPIVYMDDDVENVLDRVDEKTLEPLLNLHFFFQSAFGLLRENHLRLFGIYPVRNPFYMKDTIVVGLYFCIGCLYGCLNSHEKRLMLSTRAESKEDYENSIVHYLADGGVMRFNNVCVKTKFYASGGLGKRKERLIQSEKATDYLEDTYPDFVRKFTRKDGTPEVRLRRT